MARPSPGAERVVAVLEFLAARPDDRFSLSELARGCRLNKATAHALLTELTARGVLLRHPEEKRYSLGPRLIPVGQAARHGYGATDFAPGVVRRLTAATGLHTMALACDVGGDQAEAVEEAGGPPGAGRLGVVGSPPPLPRRWPLVPPVGAVFFAWADGPSVEAWLARCPAGGSVHHALAALEAARRTGVVVADGVPPWWRLVARLTERHSLVGANSTNTTNAASAVAGATSEGSAFAGVREALVDLARGPAVVLSVEPDATYTPAYVAAPVFDQDRHVALSLVVGVQQGRSMSGQELQALTSQVAAAADGLTAAVHGRKPPPLSA